MTASHAVSMASTATFLARGLASSVSTNLLVFWVFRPDTRLFNSVLIAVEVEVTSPVGLVVASNILSGCLLANDGFPIVSSLASLWGVANGVDVSTGSTFTKQLLCFDYYILHQYFQFYIMTLSHSFVLSFLRYHLLSLYLIYL